MRRPLAAVCLIIMAICLVYSLVCDIPCDDVFLTGNEICVQGYVADKKIRNDNLVIYIKNTVFSDGLFKDCPSRNRGVVCYLSSENIEAVKIGSFVEIKGKIYPFSVATNPGQFDLKEYYYQNGYVTQLRNCVIQGISVEYDALRERLWEFRKIFENVCDVIFDEKDSGIIKAMLLGNKDDLDDEIKDMYRESGISHVMAISGLHVSIIGMSLYKMLRRVGGNNVISITIPSVVMILYLFMTGLSPSAARAVIMFVIMMLGYALGRTYDFVTSLATAGVIIVLNNPYVLHYGGFLMSFTAVFGAACFSKYIRLGSVDDNLKFKVINVILSSISVSYFMLPIVLFFYYETSGYGIIINLLVIPLMSWLLGNAIVAVGIGLFNPAIGRIVAMPCHWILSLYEKICIIFGKIPGSRLTVGCPSKWGIILFYLLNFVLIFCVRYHRKKCICDEKYRYRDIKYNNVLLIKAIVLVVGICLVIPVHTDMAVTILDVGQGDGICIRYKNTVCMIDGGSSSETQIEEYVIGPFLKYNGITHIGAWFVSHPDNDHISGLLEVLNDENTCNLKIDAIYLPNDTHIVNDACEIIEKAMQKGIAVYYLSAGDQIQLDEKLNLTVLNPGVCSSCEDTNSYSEVMYMQYGMNTMLFTGDSTVSSEEEYLKIMDKMGLDNSPIDILKVAHHGSSSSTGDELIDFVQPSNAIISCGKNNRYGHPDEEVIERLENAYCNIFNTQNTGAITVIFDGESYEICCYNEDI